MEQLKSMKEILVSAVQGQLGNLGQADYKELGAAVDMIKDLSEAIYYCSIVESMEDAEEEKEAMKKYGSGQNVMYFQERIKEPYYPERDMDRSNGRMYYNEGTSYSSRSEPTYTSGKDPREGRSGERRRTYMETKWLHSDKNMQMKELESYAHELTNDILEMVQDATPEEKTMLKKKIAELVAKIV